MKTPALPAIERILFTEDQIRAKIKQLATDISEKYKDGNLKLVGVLKGSVFFLTALANELTIPVKVDFLAISSFSAQTGAPGVVRILKDLDEPVEGEDILLVEDVIDTGFTARYLMQNIAGRGPNSIALCTLLDRSSRRIVPLQPDFRGFEIPDRFVIGFGLDYNQLYRNLNFIAVLKPDKP
jgi:hypoxanthine phosphoribosyltransferase